jgi:hypothetical protein
VTNLNKLAENGLVVKTESFLWRSSCFRDADLDRFAFDFPLLPMFGAIPSALHLSRKGLGLKVIGHARHGIGQPARGYGIRNFQDPKQEAPPGSVGDLVVAGNALILVGTRVK